MDVRVGLWRRLSTEELMLLNCVVGEDSWASLGLQEDPTSPSCRKSVLNIHWKDWCWSWNSNTLATWCEETYSFEKTLMLGRIEGGRRREQQRLRQLADITNQWTWVWVSLRSLWWTGKPGVLQSMGRKESDMTKRLNNNNKYFFGSSIFLFNFTGN